MNCSILIKRSKTILAECCRSVVFITTPLVLTCSSAFCDEVEVIELTGAEDQIYSIDLVVVRSPQYIVALDLVNSGSEGIERLSVESGCSCATTGRIPDEIHPKSRERIFVRLGRRFSGLVQNIKYSFICSYTEGGIKAKRLINLNISYLPGYSITPSEIAWDEKNFKQLKAVQVSGGDPRKTGWDHRKEKDTKKKRTHKKEKDRPTVENCLQKSCFPFNIVGGWALGECGDDWR